MTQSKVEEILGKNSPRLGSGVVTGGITLWRWHYSQYGLSISMSRGEDGALHVDEVDYLPLFPLEN
jgi:hypothetical protein